MFTMLVYLSQIYVLFSARNLLPVHGCSAGWFGNECQFLCYCSQSKMCDKNGQCLRSLPCRAGQFGPACQYVDLAYWNADNSVGLFLRDSNDSTCNPDKNATSVEISLRKPVSFTWIRIVVLNKRILLNFTTTLNGGIPCSYERKFVVSDKVVDVTCGVDLLLERLLITGPVAGSICSLHISGGRNVALRQLANQTSIHNSSNVNKGKPDNAVDGIEDPEYDHGHCSQTELEIDPPEWYLKYNLPVILYSIKIFNRNQKRFRLTNFTLETFDEADSRVFYFEDVSNNEQSIYEIVLPFQTPITDLKITQGMDVDTDDRILTLCEVQTFGETVCPDNTWGLLCQKKCTCNVTEVCSVLTGVCAPACQPGFYGFNCSSPCYEHCLYGFCEWQSGNCLQCAPGYRGGLCNEECAPDRYGRDCSLTCSEGCAASCNKTTGHCPCIERFAGDLCTDCTAGFHGDSCNERCSEFCNKQICDRDTGFCINCSGNRVGRKCEVCDETYYGPQCESKCSQHCLFGTCDHKTGKCPLCEGGYIGERCDESDSVYWLFVLPIIILLIFSLCCVSRDDLNELHNRGEGNKYHKVMALLERDMV